MVAGRVIGALALAVTERSAPAANHSHSRYSSRRSSTGLSRRRLRAASSTDRPIPPRTRVASKASCPVGTASEVGGIVKRGDRICTNIAAMAPPTPAPMTKLRMATTVASPSTRLRSWLMRIPRARIVTYSLRRWRRSPKTKMAIPAPLIKTV